MGQEPGMDANATGFASVGELEFRQLAGQPNKGTNFILLTKQIGYRSSRKQKIDGDEMLKLPSQAPIAQNRMLGAVLFSLV